MVLGEVFMETALKKTGKELFKELYRIYHLSEVEDYFDKGLWNDTLMRAHYKLIFEHREIAGSPDPPPLSEIEFPDVPEGGSAPTNGGALGVPKVAAGTTQMAQLMAAALKLAQGPKAAGILGGAAPAGGITNQASAINELKSIMAFVAKHKLDFAKVSGLIMAVPQTVRTAVIQDFEPKEGGDAVQELKTFIEEKKAAAPAEPEPAAAVPAGAAAVPAGAAVRPAIAATVPAGAAVLAGGIKRPAMAAVLPGPAAAAQRPRLMVPGAGGARAPITPGLIKPGLITK